MPTHGSSPARTAVGPGEIINGKYVVERTIGEGGVGRVVVARNIELDVRVALKFLKAEMLDRPDVVARFLQEAKAACTIKSEHSAVVFDVGRTADGIPFLVMEYLEGEDLASLLTQAGTLDPKQVAEYAMQACDALAVAHARGIVHRDIKPENLFLDTRTGIRSLKVLDFGISKSALTGTVLSALLPVVETTDVMGTPLYMSPEQIRSSEDVDFRTDIWSLGVVMFEALTAHFPIHAESVTELCAAIVDSPLDSITQYRNDLPAGFAEVVEKCLEKDVDKRYRNVAELAVALLPFGPKRARICAERAGQVLVAAKMADEATVRFPSSLPPPSSLPRSLSLTAKPVPSVAPSSKPLPPPSRVPNDIKITLPSSPSPLEPAPPAAESSLAKVFIACAAAVVVLIAAVVATPSKRAEPRSAPGAAGSAPSATATLSASASPAPRSQ